MAPSWRGHLLPSSKGIESELQKPVRLLFFRRYESDDVFVETSRDVLLLDISHESFFIDFAGYVFYYIVHFFILYLTYKYSRFFSYFC